ncbi:MAG: YigZ family protein [Clostridiales bacterium]|nr:YigZ family protein [Clostridiales bacterium]
MEAGHRLEPYQVIEYGGRGEIEEKKSRFIAHVAAADTEEEALAFIEAKKKEYWDARHNCYAYLLGAQGQIMRFSDDGEPAGTAGKPILEVLLHSGIRNLVVVVTRYFGGTLLGAGGLVRAYTQAAQAGIEASRVSVMCYGYELTVRTDYNGIGKLQYLLGQKGIPIEASEYAEQVMIQIKVPYEEKESLLHAITEATAGKAQTAVSKPIYYKRQLTPGDFPG